jgi:hypothetical protein
MDAIFLAAGITVVTGYIYIGLMFICAIAIFVGTNRDDMSIFSAFAGLGGLIFLSGMFIHTNPLETLSIGQIVGWIAIYFISGTAWSFIKWYMKLINVRDKFKEVKEQVSKSLIVSPEIFIDIENLSKEDKGLNRQYWNAILHSFNTHADAAMTFKEGASKVKPLASKHKESIIKWIMFWPFSAVWTMIDDPLYKLGNFIFSKFKQVYQNLSDLVFKDM